MRIISGTHKGRTIVTPKNLPVRPTTDFAKESLFNILANRIDFEEVRALDLFSGTGNIALELASRGCPDVTAVDNNARLCDFIRKVSKDLGLNVKVVKTDGLGFIKRPIGTYDLIFADPFYDFKQMDEIPNLVFESDILAEDGLFILEHSVKTNFAGHPFFDEKRTYGNVNFSFFSRKKSV